jgi:Tfp pilus assembly protein PilO
VALQIEKRILFLIVGYAVTVLGAGAGGYFGYEEYKKARDEEASLQKQIKMADIKIDTIPNLETDVICLRENVSELVKILPNTREVNDFVNKLNDFGEASGVRIVSLHDEKDNRAKSQKKNAGRDAFDKVIYKVKMSANVGQFLDFLSRCEGWERFVRVTSLDIKAGEWGDDMSREEITHEVAVDLETYAYRGNDGAQSIKIQNYEKRREQLADEIVSRRADIRVEHYDYVPNMLRRDPFVDPRIRLSDEGDGGMPYEEQRALVETMVSHAQELAALALAVEDSATNFIRRLEIENEIDGKVSSLRTSLDTAIADSGVTDGALRRRIEREVMPVLKDALGRSTAATAAATLKDLRNFQMDMARLLDEQKYEEILDKHGVISTRVDQNALSAEAVAVMNRIDEIAMKAEAAVDFSKKDLRITGKIVQEDSKNSVVVVNGTVLREGDPLDDMVVHRIKPECVEFRYRGVILSRTQ